MSKLTKILLTIFTALPIWIYVNSLDVPSFDDLGILGHLKTVSADENGYTVISYLEDVDHRILSSKDNENLREHIQGENWDQTIVDRLIGENTSAYIDIDKVLDKPYFQFGDYGIEGAFPSYQEIVNLSRLLLLKSMNAAIVGDQKTFQESVRKAILFANKIKTEESSTLIAYMIGAAMQHEAVRWIHKYAWMHEPNRQDLARLAQIIDLIPDYHNDQFHKVFFGEYKFMFNTAKESLNKSYVERVNGYVSMLNNWEEFESYVEKPGIGRFFQDVFIEYYFHPNEFLSNAAPVILSFSQQSNNYCNDLTLIESTWEPSWSDAIRPNTLTDEWSKSGYATYNDYFYRRCLSYVYIDSVKTIIALQQYKTIHGDYPDALDQLVPQHLSTKPVDYFTGNALLYSKENAWLYSVGTNFEDNGGSVSGNYYGKCHNESECYTNPTVVINAH